MENKVKCKNLQRTDDIIMKISLSFFGANENLLILEKEYLKKKIITFPQYVNFLSQVALCIELSMKTILLIENDIPKTHNLKILYKKMPKVFHDLFENSPFPMKTIERSLEKIKNIFEELRYMNTDNIDFFIDKNIFTKDKEVIFSQARRLQNFIFIIHLFDKIKEYFNYITNYTKNNILKDVDNKQLSNKPDNTALLKAINNYTEELKKVQPQLIYKKKTKGTFYA